MLALWVHMPQSHLRSTWQPLDWHPGQDTSGFRQKLGVRDHSFQDCWQGGSDHWISHYLNFLCGSQVPRDQHNPKVLPPTCNPKSR